MSKIEWTGKTWNPMVGCTKKSAGCDHCYAMGDSPHRFADKYDRKGVVKLNTNPKHPGLTYLPRDDDGRSRGKGAQWTGEVRLLPWTLDVPLRRRKPTTYFVNSLSDLFHEAVVDCEEGRRFIAAIFGVMAATPQHTFQILTKRPDKAREWFAWLDEVTLGHPRLLFQYLDDLAWERPDIVVPKLQGHGDRRVTWPLPNCWIGTSVEDQAAADERIPELLRVPAAVRFLSCEPLLGPVDLDDSHAWLTPLVGTDGPKCDWVIVGGESGPKARPCDVAWIRSIVEQCAEAGVPCFVKQLGSRPVETVLTEVGRENARRVLAAMVDAAGSGADREGIFSAGDEVKRDPHGFITRRVKLSDKKGGDPAEWPEDLRVREMPET